MLDDLQVLKQRDPEDALAVAAAEPSQTVYEPVVTNGDADTPIISNIVVAGMGGSALAALLAKVWLRSEIRVPFEILKGYDTPGYVGPNTLFIASSYSGNTEETVSALEQARSADARLAIIAAGGKLIELANEETLTYAAIPKDLQPRMAVIYNLRALVALLVHYELVQQQLLDEIAMAAQWLESEAAQWVATVPTEHNYAKQLALQAAGKTPVFYGGALTAPVAYKWKISWNENAKNVAFCNEYSEFNHNEFMGWASHPVEKPFAVFDIVSNLEHPQILKRFEISDRLLSGKRPKATTIQLAGETALQQLLWGSILADFASIYVAILNNVDPTPVALIEKLKKELA